MIRALALGTLLAAVAAPVQAVTVTAAYEGTVVEGSDDLGLFAPEGASLAGLAFTSTIVFDTEAGSRFTDPAFDSLTGGRGFGVASPLISASLTIGGTPQEITGSELTSIGTTGSFRYDVGLFDEVAREGGRFGTSLTLDARGSGLPATIDVPFTLENTSEFLSFFAFITYDEEGEPVRVTAGSPYVDRLTVTVEGPAPVPLPTAGWLLGAALGVGGASALSRRSRRPGPFS